MSTEVAMRYFYIQATLLLQPLIPEENLAVCNVALTFEFMDETPNKAKCEHSDETLLCL